MPNFLKNKPPLKLVVTLLASVMALLLILPFVAFVWRTVTTFSGDVALDVAPVLSAIGISLGTTAVSLLLILLFGTPLAYLLARYTFPFKRLLAIFVELPIVMPPRCGWAGTPYCFWSAWFTGRTFGRLEHQHYLYGNGRHPGPSLCGRPLLHSCCPNPLFGSPLRTGTGRQHRRCRWLAHLLAYHSAPQPSGLLWLDSFSVGRGL